jgi:hypothetical protein
VFYGIAQETCRISLSDESINKPGSVAGFTTTPIRSFQCGSKTGNGKFDPKRGRVALPKGVPFHWVGEAAHHEQVGYDAYRRVRVPPCSDGAKGREAWLRLG